MATYNRREQRDLDARTMPRLKPCNCGSELPSYWAMDARNIPLCIVCEKCKQEKLRHYRSDVLTDPNYWTDEPIDDD